jgi:cyanophycinase
MKEKTTKGIAYHCVVPNGCLIIIGGAEKKDGSGQSNEEQLKANGSVLEEFVRRCRHKNPVIELITTAGEEDIKGTFREYEACFKNFGASAVGHIHHNNRDELIAGELDERISKADGVFISGGDQLKLTSIYGGSSFITSLKEAYLFKKLTIGGTSAGAMALSTPMIFGGTGEREMVAAGVKVTTGFEFMKDVCIDTHFVHRGRFVRMAQVIATNPASIGIGIEEDTAIIINNGIEGEVFGSGVVIIIDGNRSRSTNIVAYDENRKITIRDLQVSILSSGEAFKIPQRNPPHI